MFLLTDLGPLHAQQPAYNAQTVIDLILRLSKTLGTTRIVHTGLSRTLWETGTWRALEHPLLFALDAENITVEAIAPDWTWAEQEQLQFSGFLEQYPQGRSLLRELAPLETRLRESIEAVLDTQTVHSTDFLEEVNAFHRAVEQILGDGPGTAHRARRLELLQELLEPLEPEAIVIVPIDDLPNLLAVPGAELPRWTTELLAPSEASRARALIDRALRLEERDDLDALVHNLFAIDGPANTRLGRLGLEARFAAAGIYLAVGDLESARDVLELLSNAQFDRPVYLPGLILARLAQVRDMQGEREAALRAYRATLALEWAPQAAREAAQVGVETQYKLSQ